MPGMTDTALVLMFKAPDRSKRRLAQSLGTAAARDASTKLLDCAAEDLAGWPGPVCWAPAEPADQDWLLDAGARAGTVIPQGPGNLGERIARVNLALIDRRLDAQIFIGIDCPALTPAYLASAAAALNGSDVVLGPASDGGVVLMGVRGPWPQLSELPWSQTTLGNALSATCKTAGLSVTSLAELSDIDSPADLLQAAHRLESDRRPTRRALCEWIAGHTANLRETA